MFTKGEAERCYVCRSMDLPVVRTRKWLHKCIPVLLKFGDVVSKAHRDGVNEYIDLAVQLWMKRCSCKVLNTKGGAYCVEKFASELTTVDSEDVRRDAVRDGQC